MRTTLSSGTPVEIALPSSGESSKGLVIIPDNFGLRPLFEDMCQLLADENSWSVAAIELWPGREHLDKDEKWATVPSVDEMSVIRDAELAAELTGQSVVNLIGFCMGGMYAFRAAGLSSTFNRVASFYGMIHLPLAAKSPTQSEPIDALRLPGAAPVLALMGEQDVWCPKSDIDELDTLGGKVTVIRYPEAGHAFAHDASREEHRSADAKNAWQNVIEFFEK